MTAKEKLLERAPDFTEAEATAALRVIDAQAALARYFDEEAKLSSETADERECAWAEANAHEAIREESWEVVARPAGSSLSSRADARCASSHATPRSRRSRTSSSLW
jgi:hypothetical protein